MKSIRITTEQELEKAFQIRTEVFVKEQGVPKEKEMDSFDVLGGPCEHLLVYYKEQPVGAGRIRIVDGYGKLERICVLAPYRQYGIGKFIVKGLEEIAVEKGVEKTKLHGQTRAEGFYEKLGYRTASEPFMDTGIPHIAMVKMVKELPVKGNEQ